jgi:uncharacterized membrane protein YgdD (TMEM256/DUF423 family)
VKSKWFLVIGACSGAVSVILGAFAAHGLRSILSPQLLAVFETGVHYQFIHTLALIGCGILLCLEFDQAVQRYFFRAGVLFIVGVLCFSGSLYALALTGVKWFGPVTPFGGVCFIVGWGMMAIAALKIKKV